MVTEFLAKAIGGDRVRIKKGMSLPDGWRLLTGQQLLDEGIVKEIDEIVRIVRFDGWQSTTGGEREVKKALRKVLLNYKLHGDQELFDRAYGYILQYY